MDDNEKLIEEAAKAMWDDPEQWATITEPVRDDFRGMARAALAVFEKAYSPTDDEREALAQVVSDAFSGYLGAEPDEGDQHVADLILAAGFRRSEPQGEPSDAQSCEHQHGNVCVKCGTPPDLMDRLRASLAHPAPEHQGEPSDAQVQALKVLEEAEPLAEVFGNSTAFGRAVIALRRLVDEGAALRAAGGVR